MLQKLIIKTTNETRAKTKERENKRKKRKREKLRTIKRETTRKKER